MTFDSLVASYLLNPASIHSLDQIAAAQVQVRVPSWEDLLGKGSKALAPSELTESQIAAFAAARAGVLLRLKETLLAELDRLNLTPLFNQVELPLIEVLAAMEEEGIAVDIEILKKMNTEIGAMLQAVEGEVYHLAGEEFNLNSPKQLSVILFEKLGLPVIKQPRPDTHRCRGFRQIGPGSPHCEVDLGRHS